MPTHRVRYAAMCIHVRLHRLHVQQEHHTAMHGAARHGNQAVIVRLFNHNANVNAQDKVHPSDCI